MQASYTRLFSKCKASTLMPMKINEVPKWSKEGWGFFLFVFFFAVAINLYKQNHQFWKLAGSLEGMTNKLKNIVEIAL